jgi:hypothetical protein
MELDVFHMERMRPRFETEAEIFFATRLRPYIISLRLSVISCDLIER